MEIVPEVIWTMECSTGSGQEVHREEAQKDHVKYGNMPWQGDGNQAVYHWLEPGLPYHDMILSNNQVEGSTK